MSPDESLEKHSHEGTDSVSSDALDWGSQFAKHLELEYANSAAELPPGTNWTIFRQTMLCAVVQVLVESGASTGEISKLLSESVRRITCVESVVKWTSNKNTRRVALIDKLIQQTLSADEAVELNRLTEEMRIHLDTEKLVPIEGARQLHRRLLDLDDSESTPH